MTGPESTELADALMLLRAERDIERQRLQADLDALGATAAESEPFLTTLDDVYRAASNTLFLIDNGAPPKPTMN